MWMFSVCIIEHYRRRVGETPSGRAVFAESNIKMQLALNTKQIRPIHFRFQLCQRVSLITSKTSSLIVHILHFDPTFSQFFWIHTWLTFLRLSNLTHYVNAPSALHHPVITNKSPDLYIVSHCVDHVMLWRMQALVLNFLDVIHMSPQFRSIV